MINKQFLFELKKILDKTPKGGKSKIVLDWANRLEVSKDTIYKELRSTFGATKSIYRPKFVPENVIFMVFELKKYYALKGKKISTQDCIKELYDSKEIQTNEYSISTINRRIREAGLKIPPIEQYTYDEKQIIDLYRKLRLDKKLLVKNLIEQLTK